MSKSPSVHHKFVVKKMAKIIKLIFSSIYIVSLVVAAIVIICALMHVQNTPTAATHVNYTTGIEIN